VTEQSAEPDANGWYQPEVSPPKAGHYETWFAHNFGESCVLGYWQPDGGWQLFNGKVQAWRKQREASKPEWIK